MLMVGSSDGEPLQGRHHDGSARIPCGWKDRRFQLRVSWPRRLWMSPTAQPLSSAPMAPAALFLAALPPFLSKPIPPLWVSWAEPRLARAPPVGTPPGQPLRSRFRQRLLQRSLDWVDPSLRNRRRRYHTLAVRLRVHRARHAAHHEYDAFVLTATSYFLTMPAARDGRSSSIPMSAAGGTDFFFFGLTRDCTGTGPALCGGDAPGDTADHHGDRELAGPVQSSSITTPAPPCTRRRPASI